MSIVGPRPERPEFVAMLEQQVPYWSRRLLVQPGHHRLGAGALRLRGRRRERRREALLRPLVPAPPESGGRRCDVRENGVAGARSSLRAGLGYRRRRGSPLGRRWSRPRSSSWQRQESARAGNTTTRRSPGASPCRSWSCPATPPAQLFLPRARRPGIDVRRADRRPAPPVADEHRPRARARTTSRAAPSATGTAIGSSRVAWRERC